MRTRCSGWGAILSAAAFAASLGGAAGVAGADVTACRQALLVDLDPAAAATQCNAAVTADPGDPQARLLRALATLVQIPFRPAVDALADGFGFSEDGRFPLDTDLLLPTVHQLALDSPTLAGVQPVVTSDVLPAFDAALADLGAIGSPFTLALSAEELASFGFTSLSSLEVDQADALLLRSLLQLGRAALLIGTSYDLEFDVDDAVLRFRDSLNIQSEIVNSHPALLALLSGGAGRLAQAKQSLCASVDSYHLAIQAIAAEADAQDDDLIAIANPTLSSQVSRELARARASLDRPYRVLAGTEGWKGDLRSVLNDALGTNFGTAGATLDLRGLFDAPASLRPFAPGFGFDPLLSPPSVITGYPDPTFGGALTLAAPSGALSAAPCPPALVPEPGAELSIAAALLALAGLAGRRSGTARGGPPARGHEPA